MILERIISGRETGADRGGLEAAKILGIKTGGICYRNFKTENGPDYSLRDDFYLEDIGTTSFSEISKLNIEKSDGTIAFMLFEKARGTKKAISYAMRKKYEIVDVALDMNKKDKPFRPIFIIRNLENKEIIRKGIREFIFRNQIKVLNVIGHREKTAGVKNFTKVVCDLIVDSLKGFNMNSEEIKNLKKSKPVYIPFKEIKIQQLISGGRLGPEIAGFKVAKKLGIKISGCVEKGFKEINKIYREEININEKENGNKMKNAIQNINESEGTLVFRLHFDNHVDRIIGYCQTKKWIKSATPRTSNKKPHIHRPVCVIYNIRNLGKISSLIVDFLKNNQITILNVTGHSQTKVIKGYQDRIESILSIVLKKMNQT